MKKFMLCAAIAATFFAVSNLESYYYSRYPYYSPYGYGAPYYGGVGAGVNVGPFGLGLFV